MRLRHAKKRPADFFEQNEDAEPIRLPGKHAVQAQQVLGEAGLVGLQEAYKIGRQFVELVGQHQDADQHLLRPDRRWLDFQPGVHRLKGNVELARKTGNLDRPFKHLRVARPHREVGVGLARQLGIAALQCDLGQQHLIDHLPGLRVVSDVTGPGLDRLGARHRVCRRGLGRSRLRSGQHGLAKQKSEGERQRAQRTSRGFHEVLGLLNRGSNDCLESFAA